LPAVANDAITEAFLTWAGDLGSALEEYAETAAAGGRVDLQHYLWAKAGSADLLGDVDGINIGSLYDERKSLADNLRNYYETKPFRRFHQFLTNARDEDGRSLLRMARLAPPMLDKVAGPERSGESPDRATSPNQYFEALGRRYVPWNQF
jgi:hypothetical protein